MNGSHLKKLSGFTKQNVDLSRDYMKRKFENLAAEVEAETGLVLTLNGNLSYDFNNVNMKFNLFKSNGISKKQLEWNNHCFMFNMGESDFGKTFESKGETFKITGCKTTRVKRPIVAANIHSNQEYVFPASMVKIK